MASTERQRVSIIVPTKDRRDRLGRTLVFLLAQTHPDIEIVVADDGSRDGTAEAVAGLGDPRIVLARSETPTGVANARNRGIAAASGDLLAFCDDGDLWVPTKIERQVAQMTASGAGWASCGAVHANDALESLHATGFPSPERIAAEIAHVNPIPGGCSSVLAEAALVRQVEGFDPTMAMFADWDLWLRLYVTAGLPAIVEEYLVLYILHGGQMIADLSRVTDELTRLRSKHREARMRLPRPRVDGVDWWVVRTIRANGTQREALRYVLVGASSRNPLALRELARPLFRRLETVDLTDPQTPEQRAEHDRVAAAVDAIEGVRAVAGRSMFASTD